MRLIRDMAPTMGATMSAPRIEMPIRGLAIGLAVSSLFWVTVGVLAF